MMDAIQPGDPLYAASQLRQIAENPKLDDNEKRSLEVTQVWLEGEVSSLSDPHAITAIPPVRS